MHPQLLTKECILVLIDIQEKLFPYVQDKEQLLRQIKKLIRFAVIMKIPLILTEHYPQGLGSTIPEIKTILPEYNPIQKITFSAFRSKEFLQKIQYTGIKTLLICGIESHICIEQTVLDGLSFGLDIHIISDAISSRKKLDLQMGIQKMHQCGGIISTTEMAIYEILERADTLEFKEVLKIVK
jgi:nicotinamidase-related amidase